MWKLQNDSNGVCIQIGLLNNILTKTGDNFIEKAKNNNNNNNFSQVDCFQKLPHEEKSWDKTNLRKKPFKNKNLQECCSTYEKIF